MKYLFAGILNCLWTVFLFAQPVTFLPGIVKDKKTNEPLHGASITIYSSGSISGNITNEEGKFNLPRLASIDSIKFSMIGYYNKVIDRSSIERAYLDITMDVRPVILDEVLVKPMSGFEIVQKAINSTVSVLPRDNFETTNFYREIISNRDEYFSVAEAVFNTQYFPLKKSYKLRLEKGRSKEDVVATRLFEDFHPGGGPEALSELSFNTGFPEFLTLEKMKWFEYKRDSVTIYDGRLLYIVGFDQKAEIHEALDKGKIFIDAQDFSIVRYESSNSPRGMPYIKSLKGTDKLFAELLHISLKRKGWLKQVDFNKTDDKVVLNHAKETYYILYKQPKKNLDLDLTITTELIVTDNYARVKKPITASDEWKRKNIIANLPTDFDKDFWGSNSVISPTAQLENIIASISKKNTEVPPKPIDSLWFYHQKNTFVADQQNDSIILIPVMKSNWEDDETGGMIFRKVAGDFTIECSLSLFKRSNAAEMPDNGFQQSGIILRSSNQASENSILLSIGTGGSSMPKYFLRKTENGKSKTTVDKIDALNGSLKLEKRGAAVTAFYRKNDQSEWRTINSYQMKWLTDSLQTGIMVMARFAGSGPKMKPDMKAVFTGFSIKKPD